MNPKTETHFNSPIRSCFNCAHRKPSEYGENMDHCRRFQMSCSTAVLNYSTIHTCTSSLTEWRPIPPKAPRRSLRQWIYDIFLA